MRNLALLVLAFISINAQGQKLVPEGEFLSDSIKIGEPIPYSLTMTYPTEMEVIFPDSTFNYTPFEFVSKEFFASKTDSLNIKDSVVYNLTTFEIDPVQSLSLPIYLLTAGDSTAVYSNRDSIIFNEMIPVLPDSVNLREDVAFLDVSQAFNYPYLMIALGILIVAAVVTYLLFGKKIQQRIELYRMEKAYKKFTEDFDVMIGELRKNADRSLTEKLLVLWKKYMEKLEDRPYTKLTSFEIARLSDASKFSGTLKSIDRSIYGKSSLDSIFKNFEALEDVTGERYQRRVNKVKNG